MNSTILDEVEKPSGPRTCPVCGHQYPFWHFVRRFVMSYGLTRWYCQSCGELIGCDAVIIQIVWFMGLLVTGVLFGLLSAYFQLGWLNVVFMFPSFLLVWLTLYYAKFKVVEKPEG